MLDWRFQAVHQLDENSIAIRLIAARSPGNTTLPCFTARRLRTVCIGNAANLHLQKQAQVLITHGADHDLALMPAQGALDTLEQLLPQVAVQLPEKGGVLDVFQTVVLAGLHHLVTGLVIDDVVDH